ncbi:Glycine dehydrogenase [decarboxylating] (Glycine cleavage system P1 protein) [Planctomycetales bacterium 10988]|nr:Glycine dehydrogenase [decarboxylating] (Glycine cleavage system P1 protein) [Planctomycetales bacterium 10988]
MPFILNTPQDEEAMLKVLGASSIEELYSQVPQELRLTQPLDIGRALTEIELTSHVQRLATQNTSCNENICFLGGGSYDHFIPAVVDHLASRGEYYTSYTPYQAEASQGNLQVFFEYQTLITQLTGMEVSNASLYDGGSAACEAVLMCLSAHRKANKVVTCDSVHPEHRQIIATYLENLDAELVVLPATEGVLSPEALAKAIDDQTACVLLQHPNFFGNLEAAAKLAEIAHQAGASVIMSVDPTSLGILKRPSELGADVVVAEGQSLGNPMAFGGPYLGILACRESLIRKMPGRLVGQTTDQRGKTCWVLTLQTREQHIRRDKATSNICTNQGLLALRSTIYLSLMGPQGMKELAQLCLQKAHYAMELLTKEDRLEAAFKQPYCKEFVIRDREGKVDQLLKDMRDQGFFAGIPLGKWYPELEDCFLVAVTEKRTKQEIEALAATVQLVSTAQPMVNSPS